MAELHFYDFDGTLFRSPFQPAVWDGDWWNNPQSLLPPCVPDKPGSDWWIGSTVSSAKASISNPEVYAMLATGRPDASGLRFRVPELLKQKGLNFDSVNLAPSSGTLAWKKRLIQKTLGRFPHIDTVRIWDDRRSHLPELGQAAVRAGIDPDKVHLTSVRSRSKEPLCGDPDSPTSTIKKTPKFLGVFLDSRSRAALAHVFPYAHHKLKADHVTLAFSPAEDDPRLSLIGKKIQMKVVGVAEDEKAQAVLVALPSGVGSDNRFPHVTLSVSEETDAVYSNDLLAKGFEKVNGPTLTGVVDVAPRSLSASRVAQMFLERQLR